MPEELVEPYRFRAVHSKDRKTLTVVVDIDTYNALAKLTHEKQKSMSALLRWIVTEHLKGGDDANN